MNSPKNNLSVPRRALPYFVEFVKFSTAFAAIVALALFTLRIANAAMQ